MAHHKSEGLILYLSHGCTALTSLYCIADLTIHQMAAQGELVYLKQELQEGEYSINPNVPRHLSVVRYW